MQESNEPNELKAPQEPQELKEPQKVKKYRCEWCPSDHIGFASKQSLVLHQSKGICLGKAYLCLRCLRPWATPSELERHQKATRKCKRRNHVTIKRTSEGNSVEIEK